MAGITFSGIGSNIDFSVITDSIISARSAPINQLASKRTDYQNRSSALKQLNTQLITLKSSLTALTDQTLGSGIAATSSASNFVTATAASTATAGTIGVEVTRLATSLSQASDSVATTDTAFLAGGATTATFELHKNGVAVGDPIVIDSDNNSLAGLRDAINAAGVGVTATIVDVTGDGTGNQLVLQSKEAGTKGAIQLVETTATGTAASLNFRTLNPPSGSVADLDAQVKINGLTVTRSSNTISDAVAGVTLTLNAVGSSTVTVAGDSGAFKSKIAAFVDAYNTVQDFFAAQYKNDANGKPTGVLAKDSTLRAVQNGLRDFSNTVASTNGGAFNSLADIGISRDENGKLKIDQTVLNDKLTNSLSDVRALFAGKTDVSTGLASSLLTISSNLNSNVDAAVSGFDASVQRFSDNIATQQARLTALRASLTKQFSIADAAIGQLNGQNTSLTSLLTSLQSSSKSS
jgi:flagellar hook-associated protein 2